MSGSLKKAVIAPFALQELELGIRAQKILPHAKVAKNEGDVATFMNEICEALELYEIGIQPVDCRMFVKAAQIREKHDLSYYDSLHAAAAVDYDKIIVSTDVRYDEIEELERIYPYKLDLD